MRAAPVKNRWVTPTSVRDAIENSPIPHCWTGPYQAFMRIGAQPEIWGHTYAKSVKNLYFACIRMYKNSIIDYYVTSTIRVSDQHQSCSKTFNDLITDYTKIIKVGKNMTSLRSRGRPRKASKAQIVENAGTLLA